MGACKSKPTLIGGINRRTTFERRGTDSSAPLNQQVFTDSDVKLLCDEAAAPRRNSSAETVEDIKESDIYYDALEEENRFPLTMAKAHHFVEFEGLEDRIQKAIATNDKSSLKNAFTDPPAHLFMVRGPEYLREGKGGKNLKALKVPSQESPYELIGVNMFRSPNRMHHIAEEVGELRRYFESFPADKEGTLLPEFLLINWLMSPLFKKEFYVVQHVFRLRPRARLTMQDAPLTAAWTRFIGGTDAERNTQFKYVFRCVDAPSAVKNAISYLGGERPVLIGKSLTTSYNRGRNHYEINMDVSSSRIASAINGIVLKNVETVTMDCSWLLEGQRDEELPERVLAKIRWIWNSAEDVTVNLDEAGERL